MCGPPTLLIFQPRKSRFLFVSRRETRILFVLLWKWWKSQCIIWESLSYGGLKNTLMDYAGFMGINNWYIQCRSSQQFSLDSTKKPQMSNRDFSFGLSLEILKKALRKYCPLPHMLDYMKKSVRIWLWDFYWVIMVKLSDWEKVKARVSAVYSWVFLKKACNECSHSMEDLL